MLSYNGYVDDVVISRANVDDAGALFTVQRAAYVTEAQIYDSPRLPPLTETLDEVRAVLDNTLCLKAVRSGRVVGGVRLQVEGEVGEIGRLIVAPDQQGLGLGRKLMTEIEAAAPSSVERFELFTGHLSERNLGLYEKFGYEEFDRRAVDDRVTLVFLAKRARG